MRRLSCLFIPLCAVCVSLPAVGDDGFFVPSPPTPTTTQPAPSFTFPPPMGSSAGQRVITNDDIAPMTVVPGESIPATEYRPATDGSLRPGWIPLGSNTPRRARQSNRETIAQFQTSSYWTAPQPFSPGSAPSYSGQLAGAGGTHTRYPYFKYRAPWTYQGPASMSHTIEW